MAIKIISQQVKDIPPGILKRSVNHSAPSDTPLPGFSELIRHERTPGMVAVMGSIRQDPRTLPVRNPRDRQDSGGGPPPPPALLLENQSDPYLDVGDNVHANVNDWLDSNCGTVDDQWFIPGSCENGHRIAKIIVCGKEWCPKCSQKGSRAHNRRYVRWLPKIQQYKRMRYIVFTIPEGIRVNYRTKQSLTALGRQVQDLLKRQGFPRGLRRWHWFGDRSHKWHPHLNVLVEGGYMNGATLDALKQGWADILGVDIVSVRTSYKPRPGDMAGSLFYITRATFKDYEWDMEMAMELRNFRNMVVWGKGLWNDPPAWSLSQVSRKDAETGEALNVAAIEKIVNHICPRCGGHLTWDKALPGQLLDMVDKESLGAGYFQVTNRPPPSLENTVNTRLTFERRKHPGVHINRTYDGMHAGHQAHAERFYNEFRAREMAEDMWDEILHRGKYADEDIDK